jgi:hypothetical protein
MKGKCIFLFLFFLFYSSGLFSQDHTHHSESVTADSQDHPPMSHRFSLSLPMTRNGSGTGWLPDSSPMYGYMMHKKKWMIMFHGNLFLRYNNQDVFNAGTRGDDQIDAPNWVMAMVQRQIGQRHLLSFSTMLSLDPLTVGGYGYPLLFQTGETWRGVPLIDRQHPHNFFSELSLGYSFKISENSDLFAYAGFPGEPSLGPVAFMHRIAALNNPDAPLGHHWQDATHITFGVLTLGFRYNIFKIEASKFTGQEPSEKRFGFDTPSFDSYGGRISANPHKNLSAQFSHAYLISPEASKPGENIRRTTASVLHQIRTSIPERYFSTSLFWGLNSSDHAEHSLGLEFTARLNKYYLYGRYEWIQKDAEELNLMPINNNQAHHHLVSANAITLGTNRIIVQNPFLQASVGLQGTLYIADEQAAPVYGKTPVALQVYTRVFPSLMQ